MSWAAANRDPQAFEEPADLGGIVFPMKNVGDDELVLPAEAGFEMAFGERLVQVAAPDQNQGDDIAGEFQEQPLAGVVLP